MRTLTTAIAALAATILLTNIAHALTPADKCEAAKLKIAGKYGFCRLKAESKAVKIGGSPDYSLCDSKYGSKWSSTETGGAGQCPSNGDQAGIQGLITQHTDDVALALNGGPLPDCPGDLATCATGLNSCNATLGACNAGYATCTGNLTICNNNLTTAQNDLATCTGDLTTCNNNLTTAQNDLTTCTSDLTTCNNDYASCSADLVTVNAGTAAQADVLSGQTFSSSAGIGVTGTMVNVGQQNVTPGTSPVAIMQGYHDGTGSVAGDADLVAGNITSGVNIFGVTGTALPAQRLKTGQITCYDAAGTVIACAATGHDGELQKGLAVSYTDNGDGTITDNRTGLMWEKLSDDGSIHDKDAAYTWANAFSSKVATLNSGSFAGYTDWRVPNVIELQSLANYGAANPAVNAAFNTGCVASCTVLTCSCTLTYYWSSTTYQVTPSYAWYVYFVGGTVSANTKSLTFYVRAVRAGS